MERNICPTAATGSIFSPFKVMRRHRWLDDSTRTRPTWLTLEPTLCLQGFRDGPNVTSLTFQGRVIWSVTWPFDSHCVVSIFLFMVCCTFFLSGTVTDIFLQRVSIACYAERCISYSKSVRPSVCLSVCLSVTRWHWVKTTQATIMGSSLEDSPMTLHCVPKKEATKLSAITCSNLNRFSKFFHCWIEDEYLQQNCVIFSTTP